MRLAVLSDIHGNLEALQAVLAHLEQSGGADKVWVLGDLTVLGTNPAECVQLVASLPNVEVIRGNVDRYLMSGARFHMPTPTNAEEWPNIIENTRQRDAIYTWTAERLGWAEAEYLLKLGTDLSLEVPNYGWVVGFHAIPGDDEGVLTPDSSDHDIRDALLDREGRLAFGGHTHLPMDRDLGDWRMVNPGSVGLPFDGDARAAYALAEFDDHGRLNLDLRRVAYDVEQSIAKLMASDLPQRDKYAAWLRHAAR